MGCLSDKNNLNHNLSNLEKYESYTEPNDSTFDIIFYKLGWKTKPNICIFQKIDQETLDKADISNLNDILQVSQIEEIKIVPQLLEVKNILFYIFCKEGVLITGNTFKLDYFLSTHMNILIKLSIVDISSIIITGSEYNSIHEIKSQSKLFFELDLKEIDLSNRNNLVNEGKKEELSDDDINLDDEYLEELENNKFEQHIEMSEFQKDEEEYVYEYNEDKKDISKLSLEKMITKKLEKNNEIEYIETNANEININEKKKKIKKKKKN